MHGGGAGYPGISRAETPAIVADLLLARRIEAAEAANAIACAHAAGGTAVEQVAGGCAVFAGVNSMLTRALGLGMNGPVSASEVDRMEDFFRSRGAPISIDLCPYAHPSLIEILHARGYTIAEFNTVLVCPLTGAAPYPSDPRVHECGPEVGDVWSRTVGMGFFERSRLTPEESQVGTTIFRLPASRCFLGCSESGEPVAAAAMSIHHGLALLFSDSTVPAFRRAGLHTALIRARLNAAMREGCELACVSTLPGSTSQRNYQRLGFQVAIPGWSLRGEWGPTGPLALPSPETASGRRAASARRERGEQLPVDLFGVAVWARRLLIGVGGLPQFLEAPAALLAAVLVDRHRLYSLGCNFAAAVTILPDPKRIGKHPRAGVTAASLPAPGHPGRDAPD